LTRSLLLLLLAGCAASRPRPTPPPDVAPADEIPFAVPDVSALEGWQGPDVERGAPVGAGQGRSALLLTRRTGDRLEIALALGRADGAVAALAPVASIDVGGPRKREVVPSLTRFPLGPDTLRADVRVFEGVAPRFFAVKTLLFSVDGERLAPVLDRISESGNDVLDRRALLAARDVDGDGVTELVVEEKESGGRPPRTLVYRPGPDGRLHTDGPSLFD
jgi:hypothetical protein